MVGPWPHRPFTFRALSKTYGQMWLRCDVCRRYARLKLAGLHDVDYRTKTFSCSRCGSEAYFCLVEPIHEKAMPVMLMTPDDVEQWLRGVSVDDALKMQRPAPDDAIVIRPPEKKAA